MDAINNYNRSLNFSDNTQHKKDIKNDKEISLEERINYIVEQNIILDARLQVITKVATENQGLLNVIFLITCLGFGLLIGSEINKSIINTIK